MSAKDDYRRAVDTLRAGGVVAAPTDTVYGLLAVAADDAAVNRLLDVKGRAPQQALPVLVGTADQARLIVVMNAAAEALAARFWPGALTIVARRRPSFRTLAAAGGDTLGVRVPDDAAIREMALQLGPLTGTSANRSGGAECRTAAAVRAQLGDDVDIIVDAPCGDAPPSTVVDCTDERRVRFVREGAVARDALGGALAGVATLE